MMRSATVVLVAALLLLAGCTGGGGGDAPGPETTSTVTTAVETTTVPTTTSDDTTTPAETLEVHFINVGQSSATLVVGPTGETMLVDTGDFKDDGEDVLDYLQDDDIQRIDHLVTTHNDADHIGGHAAVIDYYETEAEGVGAVYDPGIPANTQTYESVLDAVEEHEVDLFRTLAGDELPFEGASVEVLGPPQPYLDDRTRNENNIVLKITHGETSFLLPGDAEDDQEANLVETYGDRLRADVLQVGHHGSRTSSSTAFLNAVAPTVATISSAYDSRYGHPHEEVIQRYAERDVPTYWTAIHGDTVVVSDGSMITVRTQQAATTDPMALREYPAVDPGTDGAVSDRAQYSGRGAGTGGATATTDGGVNVRVAAVNADPSGDDRENLDDEYVVLVNEGSASIDLSGWTVSDAAGRTYTIPEGVTLAPGAEVTVHTGSGTDSETDLYWGSGQPVWNNDGDTVIVRTADGDLVTREDY